MFEALVQNSVPVSPLLRRLTEISRSLVNEIHADIDDEQEDFFYTLDVDGYEDSAAVKAMKKKLSGVSHAAPVRPVWPSV